MIKLIFLVTFALSTITVVLSFSIDPISPTFLDTAGVAALDKVEFLAGIFSRTQSEGSDEGENFEEMGVMGKAIVTDGNNENISPTSNEKNYRKDRSVVASAVESLEKDMENLDSFAEQKSQLSGVELGLLTGSILAAGSGPILFQDSMKIVEVLAPAAAAFSAAIGIGAEYTGRIAVADAKEVKYMKRNVTSLAFVYDLIYEITNVISYFRSDELISFQSFAMILNFLPGRLGGNYRCC